MYILSSGRETFQYTLYNCSFNSLFLCDAAVRDINCECYICFSKVNCISLQIAKHAKCTPSQIRAIDVAIDVVEERVYKKMLP